MDPVDEPSVHPATANQLNTGARGAVTVRA